MLAFRMIEIPAAIDEIAYQLDPQIASRLPTMHELTRFVTTRAFTLVIPGRRTFRTFIDLPEPRS